MLTLWLKAALHASRMKQAELSRQLTAALGRSVDPAAIGKMLRGERRMYADELIATAKICRYPQPTSIDGEVDDTQRMLRELQRDDLQKREAIHSYLEIFFNENDGTVVIEKEALRQAVAFAILSSGLLNESEAVMKLTENITRGISGISKTKKKHLADSDTTLSELAVADLNAGPRCR